MHRVSNKRSRNSLVFHTMLTIFLLIVHSYTNAKIETQDVSIACKDVETIWSANNKIIRTYHNHLRGFEHEAFVLPSGTAPGSFAETAIIKKTTKLDAFKIVSSEIIATIIHSNYRTKLKFIQRE